MATQLQIRRGTSSQVSAFTGAVGELVVNTTNDSVHVNDGSTAGGFELARVDGSNWANITTTANIDVGTVTADGLTVSNSSLQVKLEEIDGTYNPRLVTYFDSSGTHLQHTWSSGASNLIFEVGGSEGSGTERMRIDDSGNVGIGRSPRVMLDVAGEAAIAYNATYGLRFYNQDENNWSSIGNNVATGSSTATLVFKDASGEAFRLDGSGKLLVGTTNVGYSGVDLHVGDTSDSQNGIQIQTSTTGYGYVLFGDGTGADAYRGQITYKQGDDYMSMHTAGGERMRIDSGGGINKVAGSGATLPAIAAGLLAGEFKGSADSAVTNDSGFLRLSAGGGTTVGVKAGIDIFRGSTDGSLIRMFTSGSEALRVDASGNFLVGRTAEGVGTGFEANTAYGSFIQSASTSIAAVFDRKSSDGTVVQVRKDGGDVGSFVTNGGRFAFIGTRNSVSAGFDFEADNRSLRPVDGSGGSSDGTHDIGRPDVRWKDLYLSSAVKFGSQDALSTDGTSNYLKSASAIYFQSSNSTKMVLDATGKFLIGTTGTSFNERLTVNSNSAPYSAHLFAGSGATAPLICRNANGVSGSRSQILFYYDANVRGSISSTSSATSYNTSSDQRLKDNIADAPSASDDIDAIQVRSFDWKADGSHQKYGMVAQELQSVAPEAVTGDAESDEMMGVDYSKLVPMLVKEIQSLRNRVAQLENG